MYNISANFGHCLWRECAWYMEDKMNEISFLCGYFHAYALASLKKHWLFSYKLSVLHWLRDENLGDSQ